MCEIERYVSKAAENTTEENYIEELERNLAAAEEILNARQNFINNLQKELEEAGTLCKKQNSEIVSLREECGQLLDKQIQNDYKVENSKKIVENLKKTVERYETENKAMRELLRQWI